MFRRGRSSQQQSAAHSSKGEGDVESAWQDQVECAREVVALACPGELELFDQVAAEFRLDPGRVLGRAPLRAPVGAGIDLVLLTPYVLSAVSFLLATATTRAVDRATDAAIDKLERSTRDKLAPLLQRRRDHPSDVDDASAEVTSESRDDHPSLPWLDPSQERELYTVLAARSMSEGLSEVQAGRLAEAVIGALRLRGTNPQG